MDKVSRKFCAQVIFCTWLVLIGATLSTLGPGLAFMTYATFSMMVLPFAFMLGGGAAILFKELIEKI